MARLPQPGGDIGSWGNILNTYLSVELNDDGTLKKGPQIAQAVQDATSALTTAQTAQTTADNANMAASNAQNAADAAQSTANAAQTAANTSLSAIPTGGTTGQVLAKASNTDRDTEWVDQSGGGGAVSSVNGQTGVVVLDADDIDDSVTANKFTTAADISKLAGIEANADVTDTANVEAAGAMMVANALGFVDVSTGNEPRPSNARVIWIGGTTEPTNMAELDVWLQEVS